MNRRPDVEAVLADLFKEWAKDADNPLMRVLNEMAQPGSQSPPPETEPLKFRQKSYSAPADPRRPDLISNWIA